MFNEKLLTGQPGFNTNTINNVFSASSAPFWGLHLYSWGMRVRIQNNLGLAENDSLNDASAVTRLWNCKKKKHSRNVSFYYLVPDISWSGIAHFSIEALPSQITASHSHWDEFMAADRRLFGVCVAGEISALSMVEVCVCVCRFCPSFLHHCPLIQFILLRCPSILPDNEPVCLRILSASNNVTHLAPQTEACHRCHKYHPGNQYK